MAFFHRRHGIDGRRSGLTLEGWVVVIAMAVAVIIGVLIAGWGRGSAVDDGDVRLEQQPGLTTVTGAPTTATSGPAPPPPTAPAATPAPPPPTARRTTTTRRRPATRPPTTQPPTSEAPTTIQATTSSTYGTTSTTEPPE